MAKGEFTGKHFLMIMLGAFGTIISANLVLAYFAVKSFPGVEVANTYVASQQFDKLRIAQESLGWSANIDYSEGSLSIRLDDRDGLPVEPKKIDIWLGSATTNRSDDQLQVKRNGDLFKADIDLGAGNWIVFVNARSDDDIRFSQRFSLITGSD